jgi:hypothetical protein
MSGLWVGVGHTVGLSLAALLLAPAGSLVALERLDPVRTGRLIRALILAVGLGNLPPAFRQLRVFWLQTRGTPACAGQGGPRGPRLVLSLILMSVHLSRFRISA